MTKAKKNILYPSVNYEMAFWEAQNFLIAAQAISKKVESALFAEMRGKIPHDKSIGLQYAKYVNHSYAFELLLKCIMIIENSHYYIGHDLLGLFKLLNQHTQDKLFYMYKDCKHVRRSNVYYGIFEDVDLIMVLEEAGETFKSFRYLFENKPTPVYNLDTALACLEEYIFTLKPGLRKLKIEPHKGIHI
jgi:hypothetical protein